MLCCWKEGHHDIKVEEAGSEIRREVNKSSDHSHPSGSYDPQAELARWQEKLVPDGIGF